MGGGARFAARCRLGRRWLSSPGTHIAPIPIGMASSSPARPDPALMTAMVCSGAVSAQFIAGKATRDALYLANLDVTTLPGMVVATAVTSILLVMVSSRGLRAVSPATFVPIAFATSAALLLASWALTYAMPTLAAQVVYLQISGLGPMLGSSFWLIATERFDPHTARQHFARIAAVGTLSGLAAALVAERVAALYGVELMLPILAGLNLIGAVQTRRLATLPQLGDPGVRRGAPAAWSDTHTAAIDASPELVATSPNSGLHVLASTPYLRNLAALVLLGTIAATLADYLFKVRAVETLGRGDELLRFFAIYYAGVSLLAFVVQTTSSALSLEKLGLAITASTPALALGVGGLGALIFTGLEGVLVARAGESVFRSSLFRTGYEIFYTPIPADEKRAAKSIIDVGFDRLGDAVGGGLIRLLILLPAARQYYAIMLTAISCSIVAVWVARRLSAGYIHTLERSLLNRAVELDLGDVEDITTRTVMMKTLAMPSVMLDRTTATTTLGPPVSDPEVQEILALKSRNREKILQVLRQDEGLPGPLIPHVIPLLAWDPVAEDAVRALRKVAEERVGELVDALLDPNQPFAVRRRLARAFSVCVSQRAVDGLLLGLEDLRFEVRFQCGRSLASIVEKNPRIRIDRERVFDVVRRELAVSRPVWQSHRLLDSVDQEDRSFVDEFLKDRAGQSLAHMFTLLTLVLPTAPLQIAYRGLHTNDPKLRGTALEYLEGVLPQDIYQRLSPFIGTETPTPHDARPREEILADLLRSNESIMLNLEELRRRVDTGM
jgi:ATP:ADP antiporter, AAA family